MKKVLIITLEQGLNYGGMLQAYALQKSLSSLGFDSETTYTVNASYKKILKSIPGLQWTVAKLQGKKMVNTAITTRDTQKFIHDNIKILNYRSALRKSRRNVYVAYVVGSDQVWRKSYTAVQHNLFDFVREDATKISYAASFGQDNLNEYSDRFIAKTKVLAGCLSAVSVREDSGVVMCKKYWDISAEHHVDPTLLVDAKDYIELVETDTLPLHDSDGKLFSYVLDTALEKQNIVETVSKLKRLKSFKVIDSDGNEGRPMPPVTQWIKSFIDAEYVVTDSFHGTVFSIIFNKPFIAIGNKGRGLTRFTSLLNTFGLQDRLVTSSDDVTEDLLKREIAWASVNSKIKREQKKSFDYLKKYLEQS